MKSTKIKRVLALLMTVVVTLITFGQNGTVLVVEADNASQEEPRLIEATAPANPDGKLNQVVKNTYCEYKQAEDQWVFGTRLVFSDIGTPKRCWKVEMLESDYYKCGNDFAVYNYIRTELVRMGILVEEITFVHDAKTDAQRDTLFRQMRQGTKKTMIGSTDKCGTGINVQTHLVAMHYVDCPWKPSSVEQGEERGIRQGKENSEVAVYRYMTKGTFDAYSWSVVENRQRFILQIMTSQYEINAELDLDRESLNAEQSQDKERSEGKRSAQDVSRVAEEKPDYQRHRRQRRLSKKRIVTLIVLGIAIVAVPFLLRFLDGKQAEDYINRIGVTEDEENEESEAGGSKKKATPELSEGAIGIIEIESLNIRYPIFEGAGAEQLNMGIGHLPETAGLLQKGNCVLAGHNGSRRGTFFTNLSSIAIGAEVKVTDKEMVIHTYIVEDTGVVGSYDASVRAESDEERLTLFTCAYHGTQRFVCRCRLATDNNE